MTKPQNKEDLSSNRITARNTSQSLDIYIVSWNRPHFLQTTLNSLFAQSAGLIARVFVVDNGSDQETTDIIRNEPRLAGFQLLGKNLGINGALEAIIPNHLEEQASHVLISDADMEYRRPLRLAVEYLNTHPETGSVSFQHSPEHPGREHLEWAEQTWITKNVERGCSLLLRSADFQTMRPLPVEKMMNFDWWLMCDAPQPLQNFSSPVAVLAGGAVHLGWRLGDSTWQPIETPEFEIYRN